MSEVITIAAQKGGTGKTTTTHALGAGLILKGYRVLFIDLDSQGNLSYIMGAEPGGVTSYEVITGRAKSGEAIQHSPGGDIIPASPALSGADLELSSIGKEYRLKEALEDLRGQYDYIVIDSPPSLGILTINALTAADSLIIPAQADIFSLQSIGQLYSTIGAVRAYTNPALKVKGILLTRHSTRAILSRDLAELIEETARQLDTRVFKAVIREGIAVKEAQASQQDIFSYSPRSHGTVDYLAFIDEFLS